jgi:hypothetical protein
LAGTRWRPSRPPTDLIHRWSRREVRRFDDALGRPDPRVPGRVVPDIRQPLPARGRTALRRRASGRRTAHYRTARFGHRVTRPVREDRHLNDTAAGRWVKVSGRVVANSGERPSLSEALTPPRVAVARAAPAPAVRAARASSPRAGTRRHQEPQRSARPMGRFCSRNASTSAAELNCAKTLIQPSSIYPQRAGSPGSDGLCAPTRSSPGSSRRWACRSEGCTKNLSATMTTRR